MKKPLIIGQAPARGNDGKKPFAGASGARLAILSGVGTSGDDLPEHFTLANLIQKYPGRQGKGDGFDEVIAGRAAMKILSDLIRRNEKRWVLLMGRNVAQCFGQRNRPYLEKFWLTSTNPCLVFPHPSGINRWWNDSANTAAAAAM